MILNSRKKLIFKLTHKLNPNLAYGRTLFFLYLFSFSVSAYGIYPYRP